MMKEKESKFSELYKPLSDYVLMPYVEKDKTESGIIIPSVESVALRTKGDRESMEQAIEREKAKRRDEEQFFFEILAAGPDVRIVKEGDFVIMAPQARAAVFDLAGKKYIQCREMELFAIVTQDFIEMDKAFKLAKANSPINEESKLKVVN